ncbi:MAG: isoprenyl transferase [Phycisphaerae bacterium]
MTQRPIDPQVVLGIPRERLPRHIAIIMDGNGRWAKRVGRPRVFGHERGAKAVRTIVTHCARLGIEALTLYSFSTENWKRPHDEVAFLMQLYLRYLVAERATIMDNNVRFRHIGRRAGLPDDVLAEMDRVVAMSRANTGLCLCLALNYGARDELVDAVRNIARNVAAGTLAPDDVDAHHITASLYTAGLPDPDLLIRTANERRLSNFLLWQISYAELHITDVLWPDFEESDLNHAIRDFAGRERRFGDVTVPVR